MATRYDDRDYDREYDRGPRTPAVAQNQTLVALVGTMVALVPTSVMVLIMVAPRSQTMVALQIMVAHPLVRTMIAPMANDLKVARDTAVAVENPKGMAAKVAWAVVNLVAGLRGAAAVTMAAAAAKDTGEAAGKTNATNAADMVTR